MSSVTDHTLTISIRHRLHTFTAMHAFESLLIAYALQWQPAIELVELMQHTPSEQSSLVELHDSTSDTPEISNNSSSSRNRKTTATQQCLVPNVHAYGAAIQVRRT